PVRAATVGNGIENEHRDGNMMLRRRTNAWLALCFASLACGPSMADDVADFYKGRTLHVIIAYPPGGGYDAYARLLARFIGPHIPGRPNVVAENMPGASGLKGVQYVTVAGP